MGRAIELAAGVRSITSPNPWVGAVLVTTDGSDLRRRHRASGSTSRRDRRPRRRPRRRRRSSRAQRCTRRSSRARITAARRRAPMRSSPPGVARVVVGIEDPDTHVAGQGIEQLRAAGITVDVGVCAAEVRAQLAPYVKHRTTGRPWVLLKLAASLDGRTAAPDGSSKWITGSAARADAHRLRAESDAGDRRRRNRADRRPRAHRARRGGRRSACASCSGTRRPTRGCIRASSSTARSPMCSTSSAAGASCRRWSKAAPTVAGAFHREGLVDRYVLYLAPALFGGDDAARSSPGRGARRSTTCGAGASRASSSWATISKSSWSHVHRDSRGARIGRRATAPSCASTRRSCSTTCRSARRWP